MKKPKKRKPNPEGRPPKLTDEVERIICETVRAGASIEAAALRSGVGLTTIHDWRRRGAGLSDRPKTPRLVQFVTAFDQAMADAEMRLVGYIDAAAKGGNFSPQWNGAAWLLKNRHPERYSDKTEVKHSGAVERPAERPDLSRYTDEELAQLEAIERAAQERANAKGQ